MRLRISKEQKGVTLPAGTILELPGAALPDAFQQWVKSGDATAEPAGPPTGPPMPTGPLPPGAVPPGAVPPVPTIPRDPNAPPVPDPTKPTRG